jgi:2-polyprenyl-3-methyl-5-hydroxy-6-metoxy-1,4-benzoquinol methylase
VSIHCVALIYDDRTRPETTGVYCRRALESLVDQVVHFHPNDLAAIPSRGFDLYLNIDDGLSYHLPAGLRPCAWWAIDTHLNFDWCRRKARDFDLVFAAQRDGASRLEAEGIAAAHWLPLACDPDIHRRFEIEKGHDLAFVGNLFPGPRAELLDLLRRRFRSMVVGNAYFEAMARIYSAARLVFNRSIRNDVNMRVFEAVACGSLLLTNDLADNGQADLFRDGVHLATYREADELLDKAAYYLEHERTREAIAAAGRAEAQARHTYRHRMETLLERAGRAFSSHSHGWREGGDEESRAPEQTPHPASGHPLPTAWGEGDGGHQLHSDPDPGYYEFARPELLALIPGAARRVLDVGCGAGRLGEALKARQPVRVVGVELVDRAAEHARARLDELFAGDVETLDLPFAAGSFDCVVCGDVIEHLRKPERFLRRAHGWLEPQGRLVASLPNVRHHSVVRALLEGNWTYESAGLLDETHLSFFTRRDLIDLVQTAGFQVEALRIVPGPGYEEWRQAGCPGEVRAGRLHIAGMAPEEAEEFFVYQYLLTATPTQPSQGTACQEASLPQRAAPSCRHDRPRMRFTQDFLRDFDQFDFYGRPFAFARFADGERSICRGLPIAGCDGWSYDGGDSTFASELNAALTYAEPDYYIGISDGCCDREARDWFLERIRVPLEQVTFANIFVNGNYQRFRRLDRSGTVLVAGHGGDFKIPEHVINTDFDLDRLVERLLSVDRPILVAAGPASCVLIHKYWLRADPRRRQTIVDIGSALDEVVKGRRTRRYHFPGSPTAERICQW